MEDKALRTYTPQESYVLAKTHHENLGRAARLRSAPVRLQVGKVLRGKGIDKPRKVHHHQIVGILSVDTTVVHTIEGHLRQAGLNTALSRSLASDIVNCCDNMITHIRDPLTGLSLPPPPPAFPFTQRKNKCSIPEFIEKEWPKYLANELLFLEDIHRVDFTLWTACRFQAKRGGTSLHEYAQNIGVLSKVTARNNPRYRRQLALIKAVDTVSHAASRLHNLRTSFDLGSQR